MTNENDKLTVDIRKVLEHMGLQNLSVLPYEQLQEIIFNNNVKKEKNLNPSDKNGGDHKD